MSDEPGGVVAGSRAGVGTAVVTVLVAVAVGLLGVVHVSVRAAFDGMSAVGGLVWFYAVAVVTILAYGLWRAWRVRTGRQGIRGAIVTDADLVTCPACGQRTAPAAECQWCDRPLGGG